MKNTTFKLGKLLHALKGTKRPKTAALILAGGSGTRLGAKTTKQQIEICGKSVVCHTITAFESCPYIDEIIIAAKSGEVEIYREMIKKYSFKKIRAVVVGGEDRQSSAFRAFSKISDDIKFVAIHDAARCLITGEMIQKVVVEAFACGAAIAASKAKDTVKITESGIIKETPDRSKIYLASTPQVIRTDIYRASIFTAIKEKFTATDDASLCEHYGFNVRIVDVGDENIKITTPIDLILATALLEKRMENGGNTL